MINCPVNVPSWFNGQPAGGACGAGDLSQCNAVFAATAALAANTTGNTLTFDVSASNFQRFKPVGMQFEAVNLALTDNANQLGLVEATALNFAGTDYLLGGTLSLTAFGVDGAQALDVQHLPELTPGAQDVTLTCNNNAPAMGTAVTLYGWLWGFSQF